VSGAEPQGNNARPPEALEWSLPVALATATNRSFSRQLPGLQLAIDSTSLGEFKTCPRRYLYSVVLGYQPRAESVHLRFGIALHGARERYEHARLAGAEHEEALRAVVRWVLGTTWDSTPGRPSRPWQSDHPKKNRLSLVRTVVWYLDQFGPEDSLETIHLASGRPAVEVSFSFPAPYRATSTGEDYTLCGHLDRVARMNDEVYISDIKTTGEALGPWWFERFAPDNQFSLYTIAGRVALEQPIAGLVVDGVQVGAGFTRFQRGLIRRTPAQDEEWLQGLGHWLGQMEQCAERGGEAADPTPGWPMNDKACGLYGGCQFRGVCSRSPAARPALLAAEFTHRQWDPLARRGDV
jgi:hypothetical protein